MKVTQEKLPASKIGLEIEIPAEMSKQVYEKVIQDLSRTANIPGFRKGKVPRQILLQRLGSQRIKATALETLIQEGFKQALEQEDIKAIGNYEVLSSLDQMVGDFKPGEPFTFNASVDVPPEVTINEYKGLNVKAEETPYEPSTVDEFLDERRAERSNLIPVEGRAAQMGDVAVVDYTGRLAAESGEETPKEIDGAQATDFEMELKQGQFLSDLIEGIVGMNAGETKEVPVRFPEDYPRQDLAGVEAIFEIVLKDLKEKELPALDDDFAQEASEFETLAELRESLESRFRDKAQKETDQSIEQALLAELVTRVEADLPETMIDRELQTMLTQTAMQLSDYGMDVKKLFTPEMVEQMKQRSRPEAINRLKESLALEKIIEQESLQVEPEAVETKIKELKEQFKDRELDENRLRDFVEFDLLKEKALAILKENASIELVPKGSLTPAEEETPEAAIDPATATVDVNATASVAETPAPVTDATETAQSNPADSPSE